MTKVSVIIPVYNVEKYLKACLNSVCNQTFNNVEIICINDGSKDNSGLICDEYANKDKRIKVIHKTNEGVSVAKNIGINIATGNYLYFIDSDDSLEKDAIEHMVNLAENYNLDVIIGSYRTQPNCKTNIPLYKLNTIMNTFELIEGNHKVHSNNDLCFSWRFLFKTKIIKQNNITFNKDISVGEDFIFNLKVLTKSKKVYVTDKVVYNYTINNVNSVMRTAYKETLEESLILQYENKKQLSIESGLYKEGLYRKDMAEYYINAFLPMLLRNLYNGSEKNKYLAIKRILNYKMFRESFKEIGFKYKCNNLKEYIAYLTLKYRFYPIAYKILDKQYSL